MEAEAAKRSTAGSRRLMKRQPRTEVCADGRSDATAPETAAAGAETALGAAFPPERDSP